MVAAFIAFATIAMILSTKLPTTGLTPKLANILVDLILADTGRSYLFNPPLSNRPKTPEETAQRRRRHIVIGSVCLTAGLVMLAKDVSRLFIK